jgi:hypothetical protein
MPLVRGCVQHHRRWHITFCQRSRSGLRRSVPTMMTELVKRITRSTTGSQRLTRAAQCGQPVQEMTTTLTLSFAPLETALSISRSAAASTG